MLQADELRFQIANTVAFIAANPSVITLTPRTRMKDGSGTRFVKGNPRAPQTVRLIDQSTARNTIPGLVQTSDGRQRLTDFILLAKPDAEIELWDFWEDTDGTWEVAEIYPSNEYEVRAAVVKRA